VSELVARLERELGERVRTDKETLARHRHDSWVLSELLDLQGSPARDPLAVIEPETTAQVSAALQLCREAQVPIVPFGGGSGVCGAIRLGEEAVVLSTRGLDGLVELDADCLLGAFRAGTLGMAAEERVQQAGLTIGNWPQSIELSTVGGWVATRASGQFSTAYGSTEDLVLALEAVLPDGSVLRTRRTPRASVGPDLRQLFLGSEGTLGVITEVAFSLHPLPEASRPQAFHFAAFRDGLEAIRQLMRAGWRPPVVRLYDPTESQRHFEEHCPRGRSMLILLHEGPAPLVAAQAEGVAKLCREAGGEPGDASAVDHWLEVRNRVPSLRELLERGIVADTIEVAATWDRVGELYESVTREVSSVPDVIVATAHSSHSYRSGTNLYFTFAARPEDRSEMATIYRECWRRTMQRTIALGAGIAHHHGIGRVRRDWVAEEIGPTGVAVLRSIKRALDPDGLLNPGALLPEGGD
jgi:alkyldihydroxyacetonephosphate synthase